MHIDDPVELDKRLLLVKFLVALSAMRIEKNRKEKTTPFGVNLMRSPVKYLAAQGTMRIKDYRA